MPKHHTTHRKKPRSKPHRRQGHHPVTETNVSPPASNPSPRPSAFARLRVLILLVLLIVLVAILFIVWNIFQNQQRAQFIISGEDLFRTGVIDRIVTRTNPTPAPSPVATPDQTGTETTPARPRGGPIAKGQQTYFIRTSGKGPTMTRLIISEFDPAVGERQGIQVDAQFTQAIDSISATLITDNGQVTFPLTLTQGTPTQGSWTAEWTVQDTHDSIYSLVLEAASSGAPNSKTTLTFR